jgi:molecular chaperone GrpE
VEKKMLSTVLQKLLRKIEDPQMEDAPDAYDAEDLTVDEQKDLEESYNVLNEMLTKSKFIEEENYKLKEEINAQLQRYNRDRQEYIKNAVSEFAADMIDVADNIRRAIETVPKEQLDSSPVLKSLVEGFEVTERSLLNALKRHQVTRFDPLGEPFNPHLHEAKATESTCDFPADTVVRVIYAGFVIEERLLRPAGVVVSQTGADAQPAAQRTVHYPPSAASSGATKSGRYSRQTNVSERSSSVLNRPVITEGMENPEAHHPTSSEQEAFYEDTVISFPSHSAKVTEDTQVRSWSVKDALENKNYAEAAHHQEKKVAVVRLTETADAGQPGDATLDALLSLSWYQLCAGQYDAVIATADQAAEIREGYISIETNRAHALMLMDSLDEAKAIYNKHRGEETRNNKTWEREVLDDFAELELENIKHPLMDEIRSAWDAEG